MGRLAVAIVALATLVLPTMAFSGWPNLHGRPVAAPAVATRSTPTPPSPSPDPTPSPTSAPAPPSSAADAAPPPSTPSEPAHPPAPPPPSQAAGPVAVTVPVPVFRQVYSLSCEESSLSMVLAFFGHSVSDQDVLNFIGVDRVHFWTGPGGGDPFVDFVGDPNGSEVRNTGYGVYWPPIASAAGHFGAPVARAGQGVAPGVVYDAVAAGHPVEVWVTFDLAWHDRNDYQAFDGAGVPYAGPWEHAMVVTGVSDTSVRLNDPDRGQYWVSRGRFETAYAVYGQMAVVFGGPVPPPPTPTPTPSPAPVPPTPTPTPSPTPTPTPSPSPSASPTPTPSPSPTAS
jgi:uncharacterized protein YvpB